MENVARTGRREIHSKPLSAHIVRRVQLEDVNLDRRIVENISQSKMWIGLNCFKKCCELGK
jgi:hypothetical protein